MGFTVKLMKQDSEPSQALAPVHAGHLGGIVDHIIYREKARLRSENVSIFLFFAKLPKGISEEKYMNF